MTFIKYARSYRRGWFYGGFMIIWNAQRPELAIEAYYDRIGIAWPQRITEGAEPRGWYWTRYRKAPTV